MPIEKSVNFSQERPPFLPFACKRQCLNRPEQKTVEWAFSLEKLPPMLLDEIFEYVPSQDLVKLAWLSKSLYLPAVSRIYKNITLFDCTMSGGEGIYDTTVCRNNWKVNYGTSCKLVYLDSLEETIENNGELASLVRCLTYKGDLVTGPLTELSRLLPNLRSFNDETGLFDPVRPPYKSGLTSLSIAVCRPVRFTPQLTELRLVAFCGQTSADYYEKVAGSLLKSRAYLHLKKLDLSDANIRDLAKNSFVPQPPSDTPPHWIAFFEKLASEGVKLNLTAFGLSGRISGKVGKVVTQLKTCIELDKLKTLSLNHSETNDSREDFFANMVSEDNGVQC